MVAGNNRLGRKQKRGRGRQKEQIKGGKDGALERTKNGKGWKMTIGNDAWAFGLNRTNKHQSTQI
jgi:hypothetical protein